MEAVSDGYFNRGISILRNWDRYVVVGRLPSPWRSGENSLTREIVGRPWLTDLLGRPSRSRPTDVGTCQASDARCKSS
jgi:hypothetical protein